MNSDFEQILAELKKKGIIDKSFKEASPLSTNRNSTVGVISKDGEYRYVIKLHKPIHIKAESTFLKEYQNNPFTPKLVYVDPDYKYLVYHYMKGKRVTEYFDKKEWLSSIVKNYINKYTLSSGPKWGYLDDQCPTYKDVLESVLEYNQPLVSQTLSAEDYALVLKLADIVGQSFEDEKYLVHGDLGIHNCLFENDKLVAIIDPYPLVAPPVYDLIYAFCSNTKDFEIEMLREVVSELKVWGKNEDILIKHVLINLYCRIGTCIKHYPESLPVYLEAWEYWKNLSGKV